MTQVSRPLITTAERRARLGQRHRLASPWRTDDVAAIADDLVALHATDPATVFLSAAIRMIDPSVGQVERALYEDRTVLRHHAMRRTIWVATPEMTQVTNAACTRKIAAAERKRMVKYLTQTEGIDDPEATLAETTDRFLSLIREEGPLSTRAVGRHDPSLTFKVTAGSGTFTAEVGAHTRIGALAAFEARLMRTRPGGSWVSAEYAWELIERWTPTNLEQLTTPGAMATLVRAWLDRFGPGTERDITWWSGSTKTAVRTALAEIEAVEVELEDGATGWVNADDSVLDGQPLDGAANATNDQVPWAALVPSLDPTVMGWKDREWYLDDAYAARVFDRNGNAGPTLWINGRVVGGWAQRPDGTLAFDILEPISRSERAELNAEAERVHAFLGETRFRVRYPSPNQAELLA